MSIKRQEIDALTGVRALAAWWVVLLHLKGIFYYPFAELKEWILPFISNGYMGVDLFFILSGFIISYNYADQFRNGALSNYFIFLWKRIARIYPVHLFVLLIFLVLVFLQERFDAGFVWPPSTWQEPTGYTVVEFFKNLFLVHGLDIPLTFSWNPPSWTLSAEWFAYLLFPLAAISTLKLRSRNFRLFAILSILVFICSLSFVLDYKSFYYFTIVRIVCGFLLGCLAYRCYESGIGENFNWGKIILGSFILIGLSCLLSYQLHLRSWFIVPLLLVIVYGLAFDRGTFYKFFKSKFMMFWGKVSFSLYMIHEVSILVVYRIFPPQAMAEIGLFAKLIIIGIHFGLIMVLSILTYKLIEVPARRWLLNRTFGLGIGSNIAIPNKA